MPGLEWVAPGVAGWVCAGPDSATTIEVEGPSRSNDGEVCLGDVAGIHRGYLDEDMRLRGECDVEREVSNHKVRF